LATSKYNVRCYDKAIQNLKDNLPIVPTAFITSHNDPLTPQELLIEFVRGYEKRGLPVVVKRWPNSEHAQHLRYHRDEYIKIIESLLEKAGLHLQTKQVSSDRV